MQPTPQVNTMSLKRCNADLIGAFTIKLNLRKIFIVWLVLISSIANLAQAKPNGYNTISVSFDYGRFAQSPYSSDVWHEYGTDKEKPRHVFQVINRDEWSIYLYDRNRKMDLQIDMHRMWISFGGQGPKKVDLYKIDYADSKKPITFGNSTIKRGDTGEDVRLIQRQLNIMADGVFGYSTELAVRNLQALNGLTPDGLVGKKTQLVLLRGRNVNSTTERNLNATPQPPASKVPKQHQFWVEESGGNVPKGTYATGEEGYGPLLYSCRAQFEGGLHPGKVRPKLGGCHIPYGGKEIIINYYEVLVASPVWVPGVGDKMEPRAIKTGKEAYGPALYSCRAKFERGTQPGKIRPGFGGCMVPYGGKEMLVKTYEVLHDFY